MGKEFQKRTPFLFNIFPVTPPRPPARKLGNFFTFEKVSKSIWAGGRPNRAE